jgi:hypothetical protein
MTVKVSDGYHGLCDTLLPCFTICFEFFLNNFFLRNWGFFPQEILPPNISNVVHFSVLEYGNHSMGSSAFLIVSITLFFLA